MFKMEKQVQRQDSNLQFNRNVPGCFWSIFHTIDYHPWHSVKKMLPHRKHSRSKGVPQSTANDHHVHVAEVAEQISDENKLLLCTAESCFVDRRYGEAHSSEVATKVMSEEESKKYRKLNSNSKRRLSRTYSIHRLEPTYYSPGNSANFGDSRESAMKLAPLGQKSNSLNAMDTDYFNQGKIAIKSTSYTEESNEVKKTLETNKDNRNSSSSSFKEDVHIQEIFKANKRLFAELLQGAHGNHHALQTPKNTKLSASLAKSRSFPAPGLTRKGYNKSSLQHKMNEPFPKGQKSVSVPQPSKLVESVSPKNTHENLTPCDSNSASCNHIKQQTSSSSLGPNRVHVGWNQLVIKRFNFIKQKIRHSFKEKKKGNNQKSAKQISTMNPSGHELPLDREEEEESSGITTREDGSNIRGCSKTDSSENDGLDSGVQIKTEAAASSNASLEKYSQLSEYGFHTTRDSKSYHSQSLRMASEEKLPIREKPRRSFGRNLSMPDIDLFCTLFTDPSHGVFHTEKPKRSLVHSSTDNSIRTFENPAHLLDDDILEPLNTDSLNVLEKVDVNMPVDHSGSSNRVELEDKIPQVSTSEITVEEVSKTVDDDCELSRISLLSKPETCFQEETLNLYKSEGAKLNPGCSIANEIEPSNDQPSEGRTGLSNFETIVDHDIIDDAEKISLSLLHPELDRINSADFNYMRYILQLCRFIESGQIKDRPFSSSMFDGEEAHFYKKLDCYWEKLDKNSDHQLLLDLVYETLHNVFEKSFVCFLKSFSLKSQLRPMPLGQYVLDEAREKVAWYLCLGPELDQSLDDVVGRDLRKGDDWMNLQSETECISLELEDLILDEVLDELVSSGYRI